MTYSEIIPRRIKWGDNQAEVVVSNGERMFFTWERKFDELGSAWWLTMNGEVPSSFETEEKIQGFIIRLAYGIDHAVLIPSELLAEVKLRYEHGRWIDTWHHPWYHRDYFPVQRSTLPVFLPKDRRMRLAQTFPESAYETGTMENHFPNFFGRGLQINAS